MGREAHVVGAETEVRIKAANGGYGIFVQRDDLLPLVVHARAQDVLSSSAYRFHLLREAGGISVPKCTRRGGAHGRGDPSKEGWVETFYIEAGEVEIDGGSACNLEGTAMPQA